MPLYIGVMSGTSLDGLDIALIEQHTQATRLRASLYLPMPDALRQQLLALCQSGADEIARSALAEQAWVALAAQGIASLLEREGLQPAQVRAIGSHGQTIRHEPQRGFSVQIGNPALLAELSGIDVVADFRRRDVAAGGHGAPLVPAFHAALLRCADEDRAVLNLGGIGNYTLLPRQGTVRGFDTGPANALLDAWCLRHSGHAYDADGTFAASGRLDADLLARLLDEPWFALAPPKSTGREQFHLDWLQARLRGGESPADVQATLLELTATTVADALQALQPDTTRVIACGGGVRNPVLMRAIAACLPGVVVESSAAHGLDPDFVEAMAFAWLARETLAGRPGNLPAVTGARGPRVLGVIHPA